MIDVPDGTKGCRVYTDGYLALPTDVPTAWPVTPTAYSTYSIRPEPTPLLAGDLDEALIALIATAPNHAELSSWHEAHTPGVGSNYPSYITASSLTAIHAYMQNLCSNNLNADGGHVKYGSIVTGPAASLTAWMGHNLDWYGIDIYDLPGPNGGPGNFQNPDGTLSQSKINARMDANLAAWASLTNATPSVRICEANSPMDSHRKNWFLFLSEWMVANNGYRLMSFWDCGGSGSGCYPPSPTVLDYWNTVLEPTYGLNG